MSSFTVQGWPKTIEVTISEYALEQWRMAPHGFDRTPATEAFQKFRAFKNWLAKLTHALSLQESSSHPNHNHPYELCAINIETITTFGPRIGFMKIDAKVHRGTKRINGKVVEGKTLPGSIFLRGGSCAILLVLEPYELQDGNQICLSKHVVLAVQARPATGSLRSIELPAGMVDDQEVKSAMLNEIDEEIGFSEKIHKDDLIDLFSSVSLNPSSSSVSNPDGLEDAMYPSVGACDESIKLYLYEHRLEREKFETMKESLHRKRTGEKNSSEEIVLEVVPLKELWTVGARDGKTLCALALYLKYKGLVPNL